MALYSEKVMDHFRNPRNVGVIEDADGVGEVGNAVCGDIMKIYLKIEDGIVSDVKFETFGCGSAIASSSMATELIKGKPLSKVLQLTNKAVAEALDGLPAHKLHCSVLAEEAIRAAEPCFDARADVTVEESGSTHVLALSRRMGERELVCLFNFTGDTRRIWLDGLEGEYTDLITSQPCACGRRALEPYQYCLCLRTGPGTAQE